MKFLIKIFYDVYNNLHNCDVSLLIVSGSCDECDECYDEIVECYDEETNEWKDVARTQGYDERGKVMVSYQPCVPDICKNFPF